MNASSRPMVPALDRGLAILEFLARSKGGLTLSQLTRYLALPKSSVYCLLRTFEANGYLYRHMSSGKYRLSLRIHELARQALNGISLREQARPYLKELADKTGTAAQLAVLEQGSCVLIEKINPPGAYRSATWVGKQFSLHCTALGKAMAAYLPEAEIERVIGEHGLMRYNDNTICSFRKLKQELALVREQGYALDDEEEEIGVRCVGAPVFGADDQGIAAISIVGTITQIYPETFNQLISHVTSTARRITEHAKREQIGVNNVLPAPQPQL